MFVLRLNAANPSVSNDWVKGYMNLVSFPHFFKEEVILTQPSQTNFLYHGMARQSVLNLEETEVGWLLVTVRE